MLDVDYEPAIDFLTQFFANTINAVEIRSLPQEHGAGPNRPRFSRDSDIIIDHCRKWDQVGRAVYFGCCTRITGRPTGSRADCAELPALWVDIDCAKQSFSKEDAVNAALSLPIRPSLLVDSGGGIHCYWLLHEALSVRADADGADATEQEIVAVLRQLAGVLAGDPAVCDLARVMRLPGTHNSKYDLVDGDGVITGKSLLPVFLLPESDFGLQYEFGDLVEMLDIQRPLLNFSPKHNALPVGEADPFLKFAEEFAIHTPMDVQQKLLDMFYGAPDDRAIHPTRCSVSSSLVAQGVEDSTIFEMLLHATERAAGNDGALWNWKREEKTIWEEIRSAKAKYAPKDNATQRSRSAPRLQVVGGSALARADDSAEPENAIPDDDAKEIKAEITRVVATFNALYMVVNEEGKAMVYQPWHDERIGRWMYRRIAFDDLRKFYLNMPIYVGMSDTTKPKRLYKSAAEIWLTHSQRKQYIGGVTFDPGNEVTASVLNLWRGFAVDPVPGSWQLMQDHIYEVICQKDMVCFQFLMGWMARLIQHPDQQGEVAVVLKSVAHGAGKGTVARALMKILGQHAIAISSSRLLTGTFNGHLRDCVFLFADEAFWAGDKQGLGTLKSLITEPYLAIEDKGVRAVQTPNFIHLMMASNADWVVPAALTDRRFFVLNTLDSRAQDHAYFKLIQDQMDAGGYAAMLYDLLHRDLSDYNPRAIPQTRGLEDQRTQSLDVPEEWWQTVLHQGYVWRSKLGLEEEFSEWMQIVSTELLYASYLEFAKARHAHHPMVRVHFGRFMHRMGAVGGKRARLIVGERWAMTTNSFGGKSREPEAYRKEFATGYDLGTLTQAREAFAKTTRLNVDWPDE